MISLNHFKKSSTKKSPPLYSNALIPPHPRASLPKSSSSLPNTLMEGMAFGAGSSLSKELFRRFTPSSSISTSSDKDDCETIKKELQDCYQKNEFNCEYLKLVVDTLCPEP